MKIKQYMQVELKNGKKAVIVEVLSKDTFIADIGEDETTWDTIVIKKSEINKIIDGRKTDKPQG
jgi:hypothetical protein